MRLSDNESVLLSAYRAIAQAVGEGRAITPAAEWLLDNYHLVEAQIREIREDLPPGYYRQLPKLASGPFVGYPRVFGIAWAFVAHTDSHFDPDALRRFVRAYQTVQAADHRRAVGRGDHAAHRARGEPASRGPSHREQSRCAPEADDARGPAAGRQRATPHEPDALIERYDDSTRSAHGLRRPAGAAAARPGPEGHAGAHVAGGADSPRRERRPRRS